MKQYILNIKGMGSQHCVGVVTKIISEFDGATINAMEIGKATITLDETKVLKQSIVDTIERMGYKIEQ